MNFVNWYIHLNIQFNWNIYQHAIIKINEERGETDYKRNHRLLVMDLTENYYRLNLR